MKVLVVVPLVLWDVAAAFTLSGASLDRSVCASRRGAAHCGLFERTEEERENMRKWGKILSAADTFDDSGAVTSTSTPTAEDLATGKRNELLIVAASAVLFAVIFAATR